MFYKKTTLFNFLLFLLTLLILNDPVKADCLPEAPSATPTRRFVINKNHVYDKKTKLTWERCPAGMQLEGQKCRGTATLMTHQMAEKYAKEKGDGWRLPTIQELLSIVDTHCKNPAINQAIFPGVSELFEGQAKFRSSTPFKELPHLFHNVDFMDGSVDANSPSIAMGVRLIFDKSASSTKK